MDKGKYPDMVTKIIYQNSSDDSEALRIKFETIHDVIKEINQYVDYFAMDFTEWMFSNYTSDGLEHYIPNDSNDTKLYTIEELIIKYKGT